LFPGAAQASRRSPSREISLFKENFSFEFKRRWAGKQDALSCRMIFPASKAEERVNPFADALIASKSGMFGSRTYALVSPVLVHSCSTAEHSVKVENVVLISSLRLVFRAFIRIHRGCGLLPAAFLCAITCERRASSVPHFRRTRALVSSEAKRALCRSIASRSGWFCGQAIPRLERR
jgi:hypothetical protein